jgi:uncharacterized protein
MTKNDTFSSKKIYDALHGFITYDNIEKKLIESKPFQRLHYIRQLGIAYLVFPGATHTRFEHSLGVMHLASIIFEKICKNPTIEANSIAPRKGSLENKYWKKILRLASLCHDLGHLPFSHVAENVLTNNSTHEKMTAKIIQSNFLQPIWKELESSIFSNKDVTKDVLKIAIGEKILKDLYPDIDFAFNDWERILSKIINGDYFGADRIDYLLRDAKCTGITYGIFDYLQLIEMIKILPNENGKFTLGIDENGLESCESLLLARHFMFKRVYLNPHIKSYNFHLRRFMKENFINNYLMNDINSFIQLSDVNIIFDLNKAANDQNHKSHIDANVIVNNKGLYKAISVNEKKEKKTLETFKSLNNLQNKDIFWEFNNFSIVPKHLHFPVCLKNLSLKSAKECSKILTTLPSIENNWVYISPEYELLLYSALEK